MTDAKNESVINTQRSPLQQGGFLESALRSERKSSYLTYLITRTYVRLCNRRSVGIALLSVPNQGLTGGRSEPEGRLWEMTASDTHDRWEDGRTGNHVTCTSARKAAVTDDAHIRKAK